MLKAWAKSVMSKSHGPQTIPPEAGQDPPPPPEEVVELVSLFSDLIGLLEQENGLIAARNHAAIAKLNETKRVLVGRLGGFRDILGRLELSESVHELIRDLDARTQAA